MIYLNITLKKLIIPSVIIALLLLIISPIGTKSVFKVGEREIPIYSVERNDNAAALTFNCAWNDSDIDRIISLLQKYNVPATFFAVGTWAEKYPDALKKLSDAGFEIGNHSYNHAHYNKLSKSDILADIQKSDDVIFNITGKKPYLFRAAYGEYNNDTVSACDESGRVYIQWSVDSLDYKSSSAEEITRRVLDKTKNGDIILMHNGTKFTADALETLLPALCKKYTLVSVSDLIYKDNYTVDAAGRQHKS